MPRQRLDQDHQILAAAAHAAIGRIVRQRHVARFGQRLERSLRKLRLGIEASHFLRRQHARQEFGDVAPDQLLLFGQAEFVEIGHLAIVQRARARSEPRASLAFRSVAFTHRSCVLSCFAGEEGTRCAATGR